MKPTNLTSQTLMTVTEATCEGVAIEIPKQFGHYSYIRTLGTGSSSVVVLASDIITNKEVACKFVSRQDLTNMCKMRYFEAELRMSQTLKFPFIVETYDVIYLPEYIVVVMEYCENGDLLTYITSKEPLVTYQIRRLFEQLVMAVEHLHDRNIAHRDIKPENIFMDKDFNLKLGDFGLSQQLKKDALCSTICGTLFYTAPEIFSKDKYDPKKADIWSVGVLLFSMCTKMLPWNTDNTQKLIEQIKVGDIFIPPFVPGVIARIISDCTRVDPDTRPTCHEILANPWFVSYQRTPANLTKNIKSCATIVINPVVSGSIKNSAVYLLKQPIKHVNSDKRRTIRSCLSVMPPIE